MKRVPVRRLRQHTTRSRQEVTRTYNAFLSGGYAGVPRNRSTIFLRLGFWPVESRLARKRRPISTSSSTIVTASRMPDPTISHHSIPMPSRAITVKGVHSGTQVSNGLVQPTDLLNEFAVNGFAPKGTR